jgi:hypothetical protein
MKCIFPSFEEIKVLAHVEKLYERHRSRLVQPLHVKVTDAGGQDHGLRILPGECRGAEDVSFLRLARIPQLPLACNVPYHRCEGYLCGNSPTR